MKLKVLFLSLTALLLTACVDSASVKYGDSGSHYKSGPPPHAPAHGYRHKHHNHNLSFDSGLGVYVVLDRDNHYFDDGLYFRYRSGNWQVSASLDGGWNDTDKRIVPNKLWNYKNKDMKHSKGKKDHPGKGKSKKGY